MRIQSWLQSQARQTYLATNLPPSLPIRLEFPSTKERRTADQMMNSIQNICLDAIENLEGILVATTNLSENFCDAADAALLGSRYNFSGGNIENVVRKVSVEYILAGKEANLGAVLAFCDEE